MQIHSAVQENLQPGMANIPCHILALQIVGAGCQGPMGAAGWGAGGTAQVDLGVSKVGAVPHVPKALCALMRSSLLV